MMMIHSCTCSGPTLVPKRSCRKQTYHVLDSSLDTLKLGEYLGEEQTTAQPSCSVIGRPRHDLEQASHHGRGSILAN
jgi:hypothetical protein